MKTQLSRLVCEHTSMRMDHNVFVHGWADDHTVWDRQLCASCTKDLLTTERLSSENADDTSDRATWDMANQNISCVLFLTTSGSAFLVVRRFEGKMPQNGP